MRLRSWTLIGMDVVEFPVYATETCVGRQGPSSKYQASRAQPAAPVAAAKRAEEHQGRSRRQGSDRSEVGVEGNHLAHRQDGEQGNHSPKRGRPVQVAPPRAHLARGVIAAARLKPRATCSASL